jgi:6-phosphogluconate dehydrogenase
LNTDQAQHPTGAPAPSTKEKRMQLGMIGLGRMGANLVRRVMRDGHECVVHDPNPDTVKALAGEGATGVGSIPELVGKLKAPRAVWVMVPAGEATDSVITELASTLQAGDTVIDGGNSYYRNDIRNAKQLAREGVRLLDCGTSGGVWGLDRGYSLMIGGDADAFAQVEPIFASLAPGVESADRTPGRDGDVAPSEQGYLLCGPSGAGHFVKMVHNGIEYGMMAAIAEGLNILHKANVGADTQAGGDAETAPLSDPEFYRYDLDLREVSEVWRRGSVIGSWLVDLMAASLQQSPDLGDFAGRVSDSGEGRWTAIAAIEEGVPAPVLTAALDSRFTSRHLDGFADQALSAMRKQFGGHDEKPAA